ncbi:MAG: hypothetical protein ACD_2C00263G0004 [uncultured bacterium (gcode 4)]|uniref:Uncharacterized protein n=1 Tax=uncultured bacterium (gcode 4) TaxID=1234023 RepID=K2G130_9BACT|nr:MAG: hypothetical protein ACD_2C00263G0004 [uncultured bacterium (gcode 4)]
MIQPKIKNLASDSLSQWLYRNEAKPAYSSNRWHTYNKKFGFTLVELIVTILILAILAIIAFLSFSSQSSSARDSTRLADLASLKKWMEIYNVNGWIYPAPDNPNNVVFSGWILWTQGKAWNWVYKTVSKTLSKKVTDPASSAEYSYALANNKKEYQLKADFENPISFIWTKKTIETLAYGVLDEASAATDENYSYITWNYNWLAIKIQTWALYYVVPVPSMMMGTIDSETEYWPSFWSWTLLLNWMRSGNYAAYDSAQIYSSGSLPIDSSEITQMMNVLKASYSGSNINTPLIQQITSSSGNSLISLWTSLIKGTLQSASPVDSNLSGNSTGSVEQNIGQDWICWSSVWWIYWIAPSENLCEIWTPGTVTLSWSWWWSCSWSGWWDAVSCNAWYWDPYWNDVVSLVRMNWVNWSNIFTDEKWKALTWAVTITGAVSRFWNWSAYFNNSSILTIPYDNLWTWSFTIESWVRYSSSSASWWESLYDLSTAKALFRSFNWVYENYGASATLPSLNQWHHIAYVRKDWILTLYVDWMSKWWVANTTNIWAGTNMIWGYWDNLTPRFQWHMNEFRLTKKARYTSNFDVPTAPFPALAMPSETAWTCGSDNWWTFLNAPTDNLCAVWTPSDVSLGSSWTWSCAWISGWARADCSANTKDPYWNDVVSLIRMNWAEWWTVFTDVKWKTVTANTVTTTKAESKFWNWSAYFDNNSALTLASDPSYNLWTWNFTIESWVRYSSSSNSWWEALYDLWPAKALFRSKDWVYENYGASATLPSLNQWHHIAYVRKDWTITLYVDWASKWSVSNTANIGAGSIMIWGYWDNWIVKFQWHMNEFRLTKVARYTGNFAVPTAPFPYN